MAAAAAAAASSSFTCSKLSAWILFAILLQILGLSLFVIGFFPVKPTLHGQSGPESYAMPTCDPVAGSEDGELPPDQLRSLYSELSKIPPAFDRLILLVVDGLPAEFLLGRGENPPSKSMMEAMPYTQSLLHDGRAIGYHAKAAPPTVTMPRLKAMVSGAVGGFLDVAFNFNTQAFLDDNLLDQFYRIGWKMVMLGDETWIKLFPGLFARQDGVSSFYVKDTVEVDFNVSRHLEVELAATDWNLMILHYLGLDHVGHIGGRHSLLMAPKLKEMDEVIKMIHMRNILHEDNLDKRTLLVVVSDHGMTDGGNHGGSSYEETDSLAVFIGGDFRTSHHVSNTHAVSQADIAPTLALLFGVPIPKNNNGVLLLGVLGSLTDSQRLRALQLNSWQLLRLLQAHLPGLLCANISFSNKHDFQDSGTISSTQERLYRLFLKALSAHNLWEQCQQGPDSMINNTDHMQFLATSYNDFLRNASEWLSQRATDKPISLLLSGIAIMVTSCILLLYLLYCLFKEVLFRKNHCTQMNRFNYSWHLEDLFIFLGILIHPLSLGSSSMVEEEQYTWHFLASTLYLIFLIRAVQYLFMSKGSGSVEVVEGREIMASHPNIKDYLQMLSIIVVLFCGRLLRGWHQGGVNWVHLPDVTEFLEQAGVPTIKSLQLISLLLLMILYPLSIGLIRSRSVLVAPLIFCHFASGVLVYLHIMQDQSYSSTLIAQMFYLSNGLTVVVTAIVSPWNLPVCDYRNQLMTEPNKDSSSVSTHVKSLSPGMKDSMFLIGMTYAASWCLLQLLLQQPVNSVPVLLIFVQLSATIFYFAADGSGHSQWVEVAAIYFLGMAGHFGLGNSNSLATVDVAGAFTGISSHSTVLSGILMFVITYASPVLSFLSMVIYTSSKIITHSSSELNKSEMGTLLKKLIAFPCLLPLVLNSIVLTSFTFVLLLMRNHLFVWSVFSPKYLYICAMTVSVYIGIFFVAVTVIYVCTVFLLRRNMLQSNVHTPLSR